MLWLFTCCVQLVGHVHAYERTKPVRNYYMDTCGPVHITIGDGGNSEVCMRSDMIAAVALLDVL